MQQNSPDQSQQPAPQAGVPKKDPGKYFYQPQHSSGKGKKPWVIGAAVVLVLIIGGFWFMKKSDERRKGNPIDLNQESENYGPANEGEVSPISGLACPNWNRRPIAVMQPSDVSARPASGFSEADLVVEMPVITATITRLMGIYICNDPEELGSMRSARHDFVHLAKGMDAIFVHWGRSEMEWFIDKLNGGIIDNMNCNADAGKSATGYCFRHPDLVGMHSGYVKFAEILRFSKDQGYRMENQFSGYAHQPEAPLDERGSDKAYLRIGYPKVFRVEYTYDRESNSYLRSWGEEPDTDRLNGERIAPKNIVIVMATSEQIEGQYNNVELGDPWMDQNDSGEAFYYMEGKEIKGTWKKNKSSVGSKLLLLKEDGEEVKFVPGQIWLQVVEPGTGMKWLASGQVAG